MSKKRLYYMSWDDVQSEMSIAGSPEKIRKLGSEIMVKVEKGVDWTNRAEMTNIEFALKRVLAEVRGSQKRYDDSHKIKP